MKSIVTSMKSKFSPTAVLAVITLIGAAIGGVAYAQTKLPEPCHGGGNCTYCGCTAYWHVGGSYDQCKCGHQYYYHRSR